MYGCRETCLQLQCWHCKLIKFNSVLFILLGGKEIKDSITGFLRPHCLISNDLLSFFKIFTVYFQETNPIFLFNKEMILCDRDPTIPKTTFSIESEIQVKVEESLLMPAVFHTVASRTQLARVATSFFVLVYLFDLITFCLSKKVFIPQYSFCNLTFHELVFTLFYVSLLRKCLKLPINLALSVNVWFMMSTSNIKAGLLLWLIWMTALYHIRSYL